MTDVIPVDVAIIGGGPAGCAVAISLAQSGRRVALLERTNYRTARVGETLPPAIQPLLRDLGVWEQFLADEHSAAPGLVVQWDYGQAYETDHIFNPYGCGWNLNRLKFDRTLYKAASALEGVFAFSEVSRLVCKRSSNRSNCAWLLTFTGNSKEFHTNSGRSPGRHLSLSARFVVGATGRVAPPSLPHSLKRVSVDNMVGVVGRLPPRTSPPPLECAEADDTRIWIESVRDGWWYSVPLPDGSLVAVYLTDADLVRAQGGARTAWQSSLAQAPRLKSRLNGIEVTGEVNMLPNNLRVVAADSYCRRRLASQDYLLVGDAACAWDPLSGQGVFRALTEGRMAARAIDGYMLRGDCGALKEYEGHLLKNFDTYLQERYEMYCRETRFPASPFWRRRRKAPAPIPV